nr:uncharacterized protein LOC119185450 [Rhipicephalus microplus]
MEQPRTKRRRSSESSKEELVELSPLEKQRDLTRQLKKKKQKTTGKSRKYLKGGTTSCKTCSKTNSRLQQHKQETAASKTYVLCEMDFALPTLFHQTVDGSSKKHSPAVPLATTNAAKAHQIIMAPIKNEATHSRIQEKV